MNRSYLAHIVADEESGPRGHSILSEQLKADPDNIMLLCDTHHRLIDKEAVAEHPVELLNDYKKQHEKRIELQTAIQSPFRTHIILLKARIGERKVSFGYDQVCSAVLPWRYPAVHGGIDIDLNQLELHEKDETFFPVAIQHIERTLAIRLDEVTTIAPVPPNHLSIFALAPIPLLAKFGEMLGETIPTDVFQFHRETKSWKWREPADEEFLFSTTKVDGYPESGKHVVVNLSLSGTIHEEEIVAALPEGLRPSLYTITHAKPDLDFLRSKEQLELFQREWRSLLVQLRQCHGPDCVVHLFPAVPSAIAVEIGRSLMPKVGPLVRIYDKRTDGFRFVLELARQKG